MVVVKKYGVLLVIVAFCMLLPSVAALSFSSGPALSSNNISTTDSFSCDFTPLGTGTITANITWFVDDVSWTDDDQSVVVSSGSPFSSNVVSSSDTSKHEFWRCQVTLDNTTTLNTTNSTALEVKNTLPDIQEPSQTIFYEDTYYEFDMVALDPDGDTLLWTSNDLSKISYGGEELFDILSSGTIIINETDEDLVGLHRMQLSAFDEIVIGSTSIFNFTLIAVNDAPIFSEPSLVYTCNESMICSGAVIATDQDNDSSQLTYDFNESFINWSSNGSFYFTPSYLQAVQQNWPIKVNVSDGLTYTLADMNLTILTTNHEPNVSYVDVVGTQGDSLYTFYFNVTDPLDPQDVFFFDIGSDCGKDVWVIQNFTNGSQSTNATGLINMSIDSNDFVECRSVTIYVEEYDSTVMVLKEMYSYPLVLQINNTNDAPVINELSHSNIHINISDQVAALGLSYSYLVNATDVDSLTYQGDSLTYWLSGVPTFSDSSPLFVINQTTGNITSVQDEMNLSYMGSHEFTVHVNDSLTPQLTASRNLSILISFNYPPRINVFNDSSCNESFLCFKNISAFDNESAKSYLALNSLNYTNPLNVSRTNYSSDDIQALLGINTSAGIHIGNDTFYSINFTPDDMHVGSYALNITFTDDVGNMNSTVLLFNVTNTPEAPRFDNDDNHTVLDPISFGIVAELLPFTKWIYLYDPDLYYGLDNLSLNFTFVGSSLDNFSVERINNSHALINYTADAVSAGMYTLNLTLTDSTNVSTTEQVVFTVYDVDEYPNITQAKPYFNETLSSTVTSFFTVGNSNSTNVSFTEGNTVEFDIRAKDKDNDSMEVFWYLDGVLVQNNSYNASSPDSDYTKTFTFFENGTYNVTVRLEDIGFDEFTWFVNVSNFNRPPVNAHLMDNMTGNAAIRGSSAVIFSNFFKLYWDAKIVFYDPDDDLNEDGEINSPEITGLTFAINTSGGCDELASFEFVEQSDNVTITPISTGSCVTTFIATDPYDRSVNSNEVELEIIKIQSNSGSSSSSTSTVTVTETVTIPVEEEVDVPESFKFIYPGTTTIYENGTVSIPLVLKNTWEETISGVTLTVNDSKNNLTYSFSKSYFEQIPSGTELNETLTLVGYRTDGPFEFNVSAEISSLDHVDMATIYVNALERGKEDIESLKSRIGYARDLLTDNPVCAELVEILDQAETNIETVEMEVINGVISGCKYLMGEVQAPSSSLPKSFSGRLSLYGKSIINYNLLFIILGSLIGGAIVLSVIARFTLKKI